MLALGVIGGGLWFAWVRRVPAAQARVAARRAVVTHEVQVVDVRRRSAVLRDAAGCDWFWTFDDDEWAGRRNGTVHVVGDLAEGAWPVVGSGRRLLWPAGPIRAQSLTGVRRREAACRS